jgi:hypothetical protein
MPHPSHGHSGETGKGGNIICESLDAKMDRRTKVKEKVRITLGAMMALIIVGWIAVIAIAATSVI